MSMLSKLTVSFAPDVRTDIDNTTLYVVVEATDGSGADWSCVVHGRNGQRQTMVSGQGQTAASSIAAAIEDAVEAAAALAGVDAWQSHVMTDIVARLRQIQALT